MKSRSSQICKS